MTTPSFSFEKSLLLPGTRFLLGIDEVGRGPLAGPVTIAVFLLDLKSFNPQTFINLGVRDSKLLSPQKRQLISQKLSASHKFSIYSASSRDIDQQGINNVIINLVYTALLEYQGLFDTAIVDGNLNINCPKVISCVKADSQCFSVAAASILAKVYRDSQMDLYHQQFPSYNFSSHKGYGTKTHLQALKTHGPCEIHRFSYKPVKNLLNR